MNLDAYLKNVLFAADGQPASAVLSQRIVQDSAAFARRALGFPTVLVPTKPLTARFTIAGRTVTHTLRRGDVCVLPAGLPLAFEFGPMEAVALALSPAALDATAAAFDPRTRTIKLRPVERARDVLLASLAEELSRERSGAAERKHYVASLSASILSRVVSHYAEIDFATGPPAGRSGDERVLRARTFIDKNLVGDLSLLAVARHAGLSKPHLTELFREATGLTIWQYVKRRRLLLARKVLETTGTRIADVAAQMGYLSVSHFSQSFRAEFGIGPGAYRRSVTQRL